MVHVDALECERCGHTQRVFARSVEQDASSQHVIVFQHAMHIVENHVTHVDVILVQVHTVQQDPLAWERALPQQVPIGILGRRHVDQLVIIAWENAVLGTERIWHLDKVDAVIVLIHPVSIHVLVVMLLELDSLERCPVGLDDHMITFTSCERRYEGNTQQYYFEDTLHISKSRSFVWRKISKNMAIMTSFPEKTEESP